MGVGVRIGMGVACAVLLVGNGVAVDAVGGVGVSLVGKGVAVGAVGGVSAVSVVWTPGLVSDVVVLLSDAVLVVRIVFRLVSLPRVVLCHVVGGVVMLLFAVWGLFGCGCGLGVGWEAGCTAGKEGLGVGSNCNELLRHFHT